MKNYKILLSIFFMAIMFDSNAQKDYGNFEDYTKYQMDYISNGEMPNYRVRSKGDKAMSLYYFVPFDWSAVNEDIISDSNVIVDNKHRVTEKLVPNFKYYLTNKSNLVFGIYLKRTNVKYKGDIDTSITPINLATEKEKFIKNGVYGRVGYDFHLAQPSFRLFDIDFYGGAALSFGFAPEKTIVERDYTNGDYSYLTTKSNTLGLGLDAYGGINFQFDNFSAGIEVIAFGFDHNRGVGKSKVISSTSIGGTTTDEEYFTYDQTPYAYSKLNLSRNLSSMYRGIRLSVAYYFR